MVKVQYIRGGRIVKMESRYADTLEALGVVKPYVEPKKKASKKKAKKKTDTYERRDLRAADYGSRDLQADE